MRTLYWLLIGILFFQPYTTVYGAGYPTRGIEKAEKAIAEAIKAGAPRNCPDLFAQAMNMLLAAIEAADIEKDYAKAKKLAQEALKLANQAKSHKAPKFEAEDGRYHFSRSLRHGPASHKVLQGVASRPSPGIASMPSMPAIAPEARFRQDFSTEAYDRIYDNRFLSVDNKPLSTFSIDVDTASYSNVRRFLANGQLPPKDAVRIEELINYFDYNYPQAQSADPFSVNVEIASCPWKREHRLARIGLMGKMIDAEERPASNLVFLLDVSGSMSSENKLPLLKRAFKLLVNQLRPQDRVAIAVYAGASGLILDSAASSERAKKHILESLERLNAGGSTNGGSGIQLAYKVAQEHFIPGGVNRVILATDGDFNIGVTNQGDLVRMIEEKAKSGVFLTVLGFGMGNYKDSTLEKLANKGNGNYAYIDTFKEARKVFVDQLNSNLVTIAKDVKIQVEFNPAVVKAYRLIGYENRMLQAEDFKDDTKDAGEIGAGHRVTALYQIVPVGAEIGVEEATDVDPLKYQRPKKGSAVSTSNEMMTVKLRYKQPDGDRSSPIEVPVKDKGKRFGQGSADFKFAASVAQFGLLLRDSKYKFNSSYEKVIETANRAKGKDSHGYRADFVDIVRNAKALAN